MKVLVTGGAGYIGSHALRRLQAGGHEVVVADNLSIGHRQAIPDDVPFHQVDIRDTAALRSILERHDVDCVMHFAALSCAGESVRTPLVYYENNAAGSLSVLRAMEQAGVRRFVFSSTCATYGEPDSMPISETTPQAPVNPYGSSKLMVEWMLRDQARIDPEFAFASLRYFNVAGAAADASIGEHHDPETHLIPIALMAALGADRSLTVFGTDYPTPDGTCIRDYIHVEDLVDAHIRVMENLIPGEPRIYNLGIGIGISVRQVIDAARSVTGIDLRVVEGPRRAGDPPQLYAAASRIQRDLDWTPRVREIEAIVESAWRWHRKHPRGYDSPESG